MSEASRLETSTTKTDADSDHKAFATLRFAGDDLDPDEISAILPVKPTRAHRKGGEFLAGPRAGNLRGGTGIWFLATDKLVPSDDLNDHLRFVEQLLNPMPEDNSRTAILRDILARSHSQAHITCFWRGDPGEPPPEIPNRFKTAIEPLVADIETDFVVNEQCIDMSRAKNDLFYRTALLERVAKWIEKISTPEFHEYNRRHVSYALAEDSERKSGLVDAYGDFDFGDPIQEQHKLIMSFLFLNQAIDVLSQCEYYFRRYPFARLPVSREDHARNMCEFYFNQFYIIECRIKEVLKNLKALELINFNDPGMIVRQFHREFSQELAMRGVAVHLEPFDDPDFDRLILTRMMSTGPHLSDKGWDVEHLRHYRRFASTWSKRARRRTAVAQVFLDAIARMLLEKAIFLSD